MATPTRPHLAFIMAVNGLSKQLMRLQDEVGDNPASRRDPRARDVG